MITDPELRRIGSFRIDCEMIKRDKHGAEMIFTRMIVLSAEPRYDLNAIEYVAIHDDFDFLPLGTVAPMYVAEIHQHGTPDELGSFRELTWKRSQF